ncbi:MAG: enoyl-CoA hydratase/isomerase family protein [Solirubrobacterales bacterium]
MTETTEEGISVEVQDTGIAVVQMNLGENRFNPTTLDGLETALDQVEAIEGPSALVLTGQGKFFSNGLDLDWLAAADDQGRRETLSRVYEVFIRLLEFPAPTVAALNGHAFAAGAMMALACDWRVMREDRGFFCLPEADIGLVFVPGMNALITHRLTYATAREAMLTGRRYAATEALPAGIVDQVAAEDHVVPAAIAIAEPLAGKPQHVQQGIKQGLSAEPIAALKAEIKSTLDS